MIDKSSGTQRGKRDKDHPCVTAVITMFTSHCFLVHDYSRKNTVITREINSITKQISAEQVGVDI